MYVAICLPLGDDDLDERQAMIQLSQAHIDLLLAALSSQPMTVITSAKTLLKVCALEEFFFKIKKKKKKEYIYSRMN